MKRNEKCDEATASKLTSQLTPQLKPTTASLQRLHLAPPVFAPRFMRSKNAAAKQTTRRNETRRDSTQLNSESSFHPRHKTGSKNTQMRRLLLLLLMLLLLLLVLLPLPLLHLHLRRSEQQGNSNNCKSTCQLMMMLK